jgi:hypothetical protein
MATIIHTHVNRRLRTWVKKPVGEGLSMTVQLGLINCLTQGCSLIVFVQAIQSFGSSSQTFSCTNWPENFFDGLFRLLNSPNIPK